MALVRELDRRGLAVAQGASSTAVWLRSRMRMSINVARRLAELAAALDTGPAVVREALAAGAVPLEQAQVVGATAQKMAPGGPAAPGDGRTTHPALSGGGVVPCTLAYGRVRRLHCDLSTAGPVSPSGRFTDLSET
ncbi:MAG TPA: DUF222 domain-containing protein [Micromonosporaceae bacterium]|nr:DUF222 domain-containing protein [Micromonosporaceae bacterium]